MASLSNNGNPELGAAIAAFRRALTQEQDREFFELMKLFKKEFDDQAKALQAGLGVQGSIHQPHPTIQ